MPRKKIDLWFKDEASAITAIDVTRAAMDWNALANAIHQLSVARASRVKKAHNGKRVRIVESNDGADLAKEHGRYLVRPPLVARDASLLESTLKSRGFSGVVCCREPLTDLGLCPIVALGSGVTVRVQIEAAKNPKKPTCTWFDHALEELGHHVVESINPDSSTQRQLDYLIAHFSAIPTYTHSYRIAINLCNTLASESV